METPKQILLVGPGPVSERPAHTWREAGPLGFEFHSVATGVEALAALAQRKFHAVVAELRLRGMQGDVLLDEILRRQPEVLRFLRVDLRDRKGAMRGIGTTHHCLLEPTTPASIAAAIQRASALEAWLPSDSVRKLMPRFSKVPSPPDLYFEVVRKLESPDASLEEIGDCIARDPAMTAKLLQLVNSAMLGLQLTVSHPGEAVAYLGFDTTKSLLLLAHTFSYFDGLVAKVFSIQNLWHHSFRTARGAQLIAQQEWNSREAVGEAFTAGLLHDIGKLILAANLPAEFQQAVLIAAGEKQELWQAELAVLGTHHAEIGACMLATWGLPLPVVEGVGLHHHPARIWSDGFSPLTAVHVANVFSQSSEGGRPQPLPAQLDAEYLRAAGFTERVVEWTLVTASNPVPALAEG